MKTALERERAELESASHLRAEAIRAKESSLEQRERSIAAKEREVIAQAQAATERLIALEKDQARLQVLRFLGTVPGMAEAQADVIASAFPDMASLQAADAKALTQCHGVTEALARAVRYELVPGEVEEEQHAIRIREEAQAFLEEGAYQAALDCYDRLLRERPEEIGLWFDRASVLALLDRPAEALDCYQKVVDREPNHRQAWFERANLLFGLGRLSEAIDSLREVLRIAPTKTADIALKAEQLRRDGHPHEAAILYQAIVDANPGDTRSILGLGDSLLNLGDTDAAEALFSRALGKNPQNAPILFRKGELLDRKGRWGAAIQYYNRAIALQWNFLSPWIAKGAILLDHNRAPEALECFEKVLSFDPKNVESWAGKARAHAALGDVEAAAKALEKASKQDPQSGSVGRAREAIHEMPPAPARPAEPTVEVSRKPVKEPMEESSEEQAGKAATEGPTGSADDWTVEPSAAEQAAHDFKSLIKAFEEIEEDNHEETERPPEGSPLGADFHSFVESIEPDQEEVQVLVQLAELALEGGDPSMALVRYEQALQKGERNADAWTGKGIALQQLERYREALDAYNRALSLRPDHALAQKWRTTVVRHLESEGAR
jgi:tetratricopeptide (TPR) repeat protein